MSRALSLVLALALFLAARSVRAASAPVVPKKMHVSVAVTGLSKFEVGPGTYNADVIVTVRCDAEPCNPDLDTPDGRVVGKEKVRDEDLIKVIKLKTELTGFVDLSEFPFDEHVLPIVLEDKTDPAGIVYELDHDGFTVDPEVRLAGWQLTKSAATVVQEKLGGTSSISQVHVGVAIKRPMVSAFFKSLAPVFFLVFVAFFTLLLKPKSAAGRLTAATGGLMSVVMFHLSATSSLPPLGHLTRLDKFMIATYLVFVVNIAFSVAMVRLDEKKNEKGADTAYLVAAGLVPGVALISWVTVFLHLV